MFTIWGIVIGLIIGFARRGNFKNLSEIPLSALWLVFASLFLQLLIFPTPWTSPPVTAYVEYIHVVSYLLLAVFFLLNWRILELWAMAFGMGLNALVIAANSGFMPASSDALEAAGRIDSAIHLKSSLHIHANTVLMSDSTNLNFLGDWLYVPRWVPLANAFSIGDVILMGGLAWLIQNAMCRKNNTRETKI